MTLRPMPRPPVKYPSPEALFNDLKKRKYEGLLSHQADMLRGYQKGALDNPDVAFQMPTGSGKTLVGALLGEWRRRTFGERVLYLAPTKQLAFQVANESRDKYDIRVLPLVGPKSSFLPEHLSSWESGESLVVTTFNGLFNSNPAFYDPHVILVDDAHAAENYFANYWTIQIKRPDSPTAWAALVAELRDVMNPLDLIERLEQFIEEIGISNDFKIVEYEKSIRDGLGQNESKKFEHSHERLGHMLGYDSGNRETPGAPDPWWVVNEHLCLIFEDHSDAKSETLDVTKARQVSSHPRWVRENLKLNGDAKIIPIIVTPCITADTDALPHLEGVRHWRISDFREWAERAIRAVREARKTYPGTPGDLAWRSEARAALARERVDLSHLLADLESSDAKKSFRKVP